MSNDLSFLLFLRCGNALKIVAQGTRHGVCLGADVKTCLSLLYTYEFFEKPNKKKKNFDS